jgi:hypothetical protein
MPTGREDEPLEKMQKRWLCSGNGVDDSLSNRSTLVRLGHCCSTVSLYFIDESAERITVCRLTVHSIPCTVSLVVTGLRNRAGSQRDVFVTKAETVKREHRASLVCQGKNGVARSI